MGSGGNLWGFGYVPQVKPAGDKYDLALGLMDAGLQGFKAYQGAQDKAAARAQAAELARGKLGLARDAAEARAAREAMRADENAKRLALMERELERKSDRDAAGVEEAAAKRAAAQRAGASKQALSGLSLQEPELREGFPGMAVAALQPGSLRVDEEGTTADVSNILSATPGSYIGEPGNTRAPLQDVLAVLNPAQAAAKERMAREALEKQQAALAAAEERARIGAGARIESTRMQQAGASDRDVARRASEEEKARLKAEGAAAAASERDTARERGKAVEYARRVTRALTASRAKAPKAMDLLMEQSLAGKVDMEAARRAGLEQEAAEIQSVIAQMEATGVPRAQQEAIMRGLGVAPKQQAPKAPVPQEPEKQLTPDDEVAKLQAELEKYERQKKNRKR